MAILLPFKTELSTCLEPLKKEEPRKIGADKAC
jgi:hypothetical protein